MALVSLLHGTPVAGKPAVPAPEGRRVVRIFYRDRQQLQELAAWREPWEVHPDQGYLVLDATQEEVKRLQAVGYRLEIDPEQTAALAAATRSAAVAAGPPDQLGGIPGFPCYLTVEEGMAAAAAMAAAHPRLATWIDSGDSWEKLTTGGAPGYDIRVLRLTNAGVPGLKPKLFVMSAVHAREYATAELNLRFARYLVDNYGHDADITWLLDYREVHLLLHTNPDGRKWAESGYLWRKNTDNDYCTGTDERGVDLNRNYSFQWACCGGSSPFACFETFHGPAPASEPETRAVQAYLRAQFADQRQADLSAAAPLTSTGVLVDLHSYGKLVLWPWGFTTAPAPNGSALQTLGRKLAYFNGYTPQQAAYLYMTDGTTDDFAYGELGLAAYTLELGTSFFQDCASFETEILPRNLLALVYAAKVADRPYVTPAGPDAVGLAVSPQVAAAGEPAELTATLDDTLYSQAGGTEPIQAIAAAEYYVDILPWHPATAGGGRPLAAADGAFDATVEAVTARIDTTGMSPGRHILFVRGQDVAGNWGAVSAAFITVTIPASRLHLPLVGRGG
jgi:carboxypeptidase T